MSYTVLQINSVANLGSTGRIAEQIGSRIQARGWRSFIGYGRSSQNSSSALIKIGSKKDIFSHIGLSLLWDKHGLGSKNASYSFINKIKEIRPDIVHIHNLHGYYLNYPILFDFLYNHNIPTIITLHDFWLITGHCAYINDCCNKWESGCFNCPRLSSYPRSFTDNAKANWIKKNKLFQKYDNITIVPVSYWLNKRIQKSLLRQVPSQVIHNGIDLDTFYPDFAPSKYISKNHFNILAVATKWTESNGFRDIISLSPFLNEDERIIIVGVNDRQLKNLPKNVVGIKRTEDLAELRRLYSQSDIFLNPNKEVTFGLVTTEALACGTPSIVFRDTAGEEIVDKDSGFVIDSISDSLNIFKGLKSGERNLNPQSCRSRIASNFSLSKQLDSYMNLYDRVLNQNR